jgi:CopG family transcriptional regulator, nickel-responsive regulator
LSGEAAKETVLQRITISLDDDLLATVDQLCTRRGYTSRSEALRDLIRDSSMHKAADTDGKGECFAALSYVYDHETRDLARRLTETQHHHHDLSVSTLHVHISHQDCLEVAILKGPIDMVRAVADGVTTQRGVRFGHVHIVPIEPAGHHSHSHAHDAVPGKTEPKS